MSFSFNLGENTQVSAKVSNYFKPYTINKINTIKVEKKDGDKKDGGKWNALEVEYSLTDGGSVKKMYFYDTDDKAGTTRGVYQNQPCFPSSYETIKQLAIHILGNYNTASFEKFKKFVNTKVKTMAQFIDAFIKLTNEAPANDNLYIKVIGRKNKEDGRIYSDIPAPCAVTKGKDDKYTHVDESGNTVPNDTYIINFLSDKENGLTFTAGELKKQAEYAKAKPTDMDTKLNSEDDSLNINDNDDLNIDDLDDDLGNLDL